MGLTRPRASILSTLYASILSALYTTRTQDRGVEGVDAGLLSAVPLLSRRGGQCRRASQTHVNNAHVTDTQTSVMHVISTSHKPHTSEGKEPNASYAGALITKEVSHALTD